MTERLNKFSGKVYLGCVCAEDYPEQEPEYKLAKWYDLLWFLVPILGFLLFVVSIEERKGQTNDSKCN